MAAIRELDGGPGHRVDVTILGRRGRRPPGVAFRAGLCRDWFSCDPRPSRKMAATRGQGVGGSDRRGIAILGHPGGWPPPSPASPGLSRRRCGCDPRPSRRMAATWPWPHGTAAREDSRVVILGRHGRRPPAPKPRSGAQSVDRSCDPRPPRTAAASTRPCTAMGKSRINYDPRPSGEWPLTTVTPRWVFVPTPLRPRPPPVATTRSTSRSRGRTWTAWHNPWLATALPASIQLRFADPNPPRVSAL